jgi:hypothetical protein
MHRGPVRCFATRSVEKGVSRTTDGFEMSGRLSCDLDDRPTHCLLHPLSRAIEARMK